MIKTINKNIGGLSEITEAIMAGCPQNHVIRYELSKADGRTVIVSCCNDGNSLNVTHMITSRDDAHSLAQDLLVGEKQAVVEMSNGLILKWMIEGERGVSHAS